MESKHELYERGAALIASFCSKNNIQMPELKPHNAAKNGNWRIGMCAYYRPSYIAISVERCASIGLLGQSWSAPGYTVDRTPYGVLAHELGHHVDLIRGTMRGKYYSDFGERIRAESGEEQISSYAPNDAEWFAEMFRVFVTNPDLLSKLRPKTHGIFLREGFVPVVETSWEETLSAAPARTFASASKKVAIAARRNAASAAVSTPQLSMF